MWVLRVGLSYCYQTCDFFARHKFQVAETNIFLNTDGLCVQQFKESLPTFNYACPVIVTNVFSSVLGKFGLVGVVYTARKVIID
jgi:hypothetical protein